MKTRKIVSILIMSAFVLAFMATACFAQAAAPDVKKEPRVITLQGKIEFMEQLGGYYVHGVKPGGEWMILNQNPEVLKKYMEGKKTLTIEGTLRGTERITIMKIDGKQYTAEKPAK
jgi:hypothetical protein